MADDGIRVEGLDVMVRNLADLSPEVRTELATTLFQEAELVIGDSKENYVPVDLGILKSSGFVNPPEDQGDRISVTMGFGGAAKAYAIPQHERLDYRHTTGGPKFLERPLLAAAQRILAALGGILERVKR